MTAIEALYIFDEHNNPLLEHTYTGRPVSGSTLLPLYLSEPSPRPSLIYLPNTNPPTLLYSIIQDQLLFLAPCSSDGEPLQVLEFLHRVGDVLEDFLGAPLLASKIEGNYEVVAQLLSEMVDGGVIACTEPNALRDVVEAPNFMKTLLGGVGLPSNTPSSLTPSTTPFSLTPRQPSRFSPSIPSPSLPPSSSPVPWRRANVRHTSNELYVDILETLSITSSPSGLPLSAIANGSIAFTAKVSGIPDLILQLSCPGGIANTISLPAFHPCVRLNRWRDRPGDLSFVPPDGRFVLCGYEVDLLGPGALDAFSTKKSKSTNSKLNIPATISLSTSLGPQGTDFSATLALNPRYAGKPKPSPSPSPSHSQSSFPSSRSSRGIPGAIGNLSASNFINNSQGTTAAPTIEELVVHIPLPEKVKNVVDLRVPRAAGDAGYAPGDRCIEWRISAREIAGLMAMDRGSGTGPTVTLFGTVVSQDEDSDDAGALDGGPVALSNPYNYTDDDGSNEQGYQSPTTPELSQKQREDRDSKRVKLNKVLMPSCATVSFSVKGWLASGIRVEALSLDQKRSQGLGAGVQPYKGVKYLCVSRRGVECRA